MPVCQMPASDLTHGYIYSRYWMWYHNTWTWYTNTRPTACSFVEKALRVAEAGAVGMVVVNTEDSMISPGDSAREGGDVSIPVVGIRSSDVAKLIECEGQQKVSLTFKPISPLTAQQRKHLRALSSIWAKEGRLPEVCDRVRARTRGMRALRALTSAAYRAGNAQHRHQGCARTRMRTERALRVRTHTTRTHAHTYIYIHTHTHTHTHS